MKKGFKVMRYQWTKMLLYECERAKWKRISLLAIDMKKIIHHTSKTRNPGRYFSAQNPNLKKRRST